MTKVTRIRIDSPRKTAAGKIRRAAGNTCLVMTPSFTPGESGSDRKTKPWDSRFPVDRRLTVTGIFLLRFRGEQIGSPPTDVLPDKPNKISFEPEISQSAPFYEKRDSGDKPKSLLLFPWCRRGDSNPHGVPLPTRTRPRPRACLALELEGHNLLSWKKSAGLWVFAFPRASATYIRANLHPWFWRSQ